MNFELQPLTEPGKKLVVLAEEHAADFATRADQHDREGSFPAENIKAMQKSGLMAAPVPEEFGGMGVDSVHDLSLCMGRLGRGDASTAIATNMHLSSAWAVNRTRNAAVAAGDAQLVTATEGLLRGIGSAVLVTCVLGTEPGTDLRHPLTEAIRDGDSWVLNGHKIFGTMSPVTNLFFVAVRVPDEDGGYRAGIAFVLNGTAGMDVKDNWDALGMRASGSHDVVFKDCRIPEASLVARGEWGTLSGQGLETGVFGNLGLVAAFLGIAEAAQDHIIELVTTRHKAERLSVQRVIAENEIDLATCRAMLTRTGMAADAYAAEHRFSVGAPDELHELHKDVQCTKTVVNRKAIEIVDRALTLSGGSGYLTKSPLSRMYRDVRAGPFMQPFSPNEAFEYIGKVTLGLDPEIES